MTKRVLYCAICVIGLAFISPAFAESVGNPDPGFPHDTIIIHVMKAESGPKQCDGGHSLFLRQSGGTIPPTTINITMVDWNQVDNDGDGRLDEDPVADTIDEDSDGLDGEDPIEPGSITKAIDCDAWGDGKVSLVIRDANPAPGVISTQKWYIRLIGKPEQNFAFTSYANQTVSCVTNPGPDSVLDTADDFVECTSGDQADWVQLASFNLADGGCVKQVQLGGKGVKAGGKTPFCDVTDGFTVNVIEADTNGDGIIDGNDTVSLTDQFIFSVSCVDNPLTDLDETQYCPLSDIIWDVDEDVTTSQAKAQIFVSHTGSANVRTGKISK